MDRFTYIFRSDCKIKGSHVVLHSNSIAELNALIELHPYKDHITPAYISIGDNENKVLYQCDDMLVTGVTIDEIVEKCLKSKMNRKETVIAKFTCVDDDHIKFN